MTVLEKGVNPSFLQRRSRRLFTVLDYNWIIFPLSFTAVLYGMLNFLGRDNQCPLALDCCLLGVN